MKNIIIHIPHDGWEFPNELKKYCTISDEELEKYHKTMSDVNLNHIIESLEYTKISFSYSGSMIPNEILKNKNKYNFQSIMLEVNRDCYIGKDEFTIPKEHWHLYWTIKEICEF